MPVNLCYTQKVRGFQQEKVKYSKESVEIRLKRTKHQCPYCGSSAVTVEPIRSRRIHGEPLGSCRKFQARNQYDFLSQTRDEAVFCRKLHFQGKKNGDAPSTPPEYGQKNGVVDCFRPLDLLWRRLKSIL